jgi:hypothetical protein
MCAAEVTRRSPIAERIDASREARRREGTGLLFCRCQDDDDNEAPEMRRRHEERGPPREREHFELRRSAREGVWWQARDGLRIRLAATECDEPLVEREGVSVAAVLLALIVCGGARR